ncbi:MAG: ATP-binding protein [Candidatus Atribacteria bacterium]|nr:ATP-binding protein [Candidatus Atribacteria bacterium]
METPFSFGKIVSGSFFINRTDEVKRLSSNFASGLNTMIVSPRRWGKSSLVKKAAEVTEKQNKKIKVCSIDMFAINSEKEFYEALATRVIKKSSGKIEEWANIAKNFIKGVIPIISFGVDPVNDFKIKFEYQNNEVPFAEILNLPEKVALKKQIRMVICVDEFQKISQISEGISFQQKLRSVWQYHTNVSYCLYGSKRHLINELFQSQSLPFYRFGDMLYLTKIKESHWIDHIKTSFEKSDRIISVDLIKKIIEIAQNQPYYIQQLAHQVFINTDKEVNDETIENAIEEIFLYNGIMYVRDIENLTSLQLNLLRAILAGEIALTSKEVIKKYNLGTTGNVQRLKQSLEMKEIIDFFEKKPEFIDPFFEFWCRRNLT